MAPHAACNVLPFPLCLAVLGLTRAPLHSTMAHMKDQINPQPILCVLGFFIAVCSFAIVALLAEAIIMLFAV